MGEGAEEDVTWEGAEKLVFQTALASRAGRYSWALVIVPNLGMMYENLKSRERIPTKSLVMGNRMSSFSLSHPRLFVHFYFDVMVYSIPS